MQSDTSTLLDQIAQSIGSTGASVPEPKIMALEKPIWIARLRFIFPIHIGWQGHTFIIQTATDWTFEEVWSGLRTMFPENWHC